MTGRPEACSRSIGPSSPTSTETKINCAMAPALCRSRLDYSDTRPIRRLSAIRVSISSTWPIGSAIRTGRSRSGGPGPAGTWFAGPARSGGRSGQAVAPPSDNPVADALMHMAFPARSALWNGPRGMPDESVLIKLVDARSKFCATFCHRRMDMRHPHGRPSMGLWYAGRRARKADSRLAHDPLRSSQSARTRCVRPLEGLELSSER